MNLLASVFAAQQQQGSPFGILILILPFGLLIWLMVMPQRKQRARQQQLMSKLAVGDEVITTGGIVGQITHLEDDLVHLEVDHDVVIRVAKSSISRSLEEPDPAATPAKKSRGGLLGALSGGGSVADGDDAPVDVRSTKTGATKAAAKSSGTGVGAARSASSKTATGKGGAGSSAKATSRKK